MLARSKLRFVAPFVSLYTVACARSEESCPNVAQSSFIPQSTAAIVALMILAFPAVLWFSAYLIPQLWMAFGPIPNLKNKYPGAKYGLVTGAGSGIGKALCFKLASQGLNIVAVSIDDDFLKGTIAELRAMYPELDIRAVGCTFSPGSNYMEAIMKATEDIPIQIVFNNAGFIVLGFFEQAPLGKLLANVECNATATVAITHHFVKKMISQKLKGCIVFTSSVAGFIPTPFAAMYSSTKAFVSQFASSIHVELANSGIDVCAVHPSPVSSNFYDKVDHKIELMEAAQKSAVPPQDLPNDILRSIGRCALRDLGSMAWGTRMGTWFLPYNFFTVAFTMAAPYLPDYKNHNANRK